MRAERLMEGLCFGEGPRWHEGALWFSDMHARRILRVTPDGEWTTALTIADQPSGLGWLPAIHGGDLLVVAMTERQLLRWNGAELSVHADLGPLASFHCNDMVVDRHGRAYIGNFGFDLHGHAAPRPAELICVDPEGRTRIVADQLMFPNGTVITPDGHTLIVAESWGARLTAFDVQGDGALTNRRIWAPMPDGVVPDGICLDEAGGIWSASPSTNECIRQVEGGAVTHRVTLDQGAYACMLGGQDGRTLFILTAADSDPDACREKRSGRLEVCTAPYAHAGLP